MQTLVKAQAFRGCITATAVFALEVALSTLGVVHFVKMLSHITSRRERAAADGAAMLYVARMQTLVKSQISGGAVATSAEIALELRTSTS